MTCRSGQKRFGIKQDFISLFSFMYVQILCQGQKAILTIVEFEFFDIFYSKFQLVSTFSICSQFCVENWLLCCDLSCKWVTCSSGCRRVWKQALHIQFIPLRCPQMQTLCHAYNITHTAPAPFGSASQCFSIPINLWCKQSINVYLLL